MPSRLHQFEDYTSGLSKTTGADKLFNGGGRSITSGRHGGPTQWSLSPRHSYSYPAGAQCGAYFRGRSSHRSGVRNSVRPDDGLRQMVGPDMVIQLRDDAAPFYVNGARPIAFDDRAEVMCKLDDLVKKKMIVPVSEQLDWATPMVVIRSPCGKLRLSVDHTRLNKFVNGLSTQLERLGTRWLKLTVKVASSPVSTP